jgi:DNA polymerase elongation subunit (family B)
MFLYAEDVIVSKYGDVHILSRNEQGQKVVIKLFGVNPFRCYVVGSSLADVTQFLEQNKLEYFQVLRDSRFIVERCNGDPSIRQELVTIILKNAFQRYKIDKAALKKNCHLKFYDTKFDASVNALTIIQDHLRLGCWFECESMGCNFTDVKLRDDCRNPAPLWLHSFDIETTGLDKEASDARIIMIGACEGRVNGPIEKEIVWINRTERGDRPEWFNERFPNADLRWFLEETKMLENWRQTMRKSSVLTGYNSHNFDMPYVFERTPESHRSFGSTDKMSTLTTKVQSSKQKGTVEYEFVDTEGILHIDMMHVAMQQLKLPTYSLNSVSRKILKEEKEDVKPSEIVPFFESDDPEKFWKLVAYQVLDARLPYRLLQAMNSYEYVAGFTRIVPVPPSYIFGRGQMIRVFSYIRSVMKKKFPKHFIGEKTENRKETEFGYEGGCVLDPVKGVYTQFIVILDFMSLYPSIAVANNFSFETVLNDRFAADRAIQLGHEVAVFDIGDGESAYFIQDVPGILPCVIEQLLAERREAKANMKKSAPGSLDYEYFNTTQLSVKVLANSIYGYCGTPYAPVFEPFIARAITAVGRNMIESTRDRLEDCEPNTKVIYGGKFTILLDTFGCCSLLTWLFHLNPKPAIPSLSKE